MAVNSVSSNSNAVDAAKQASDAQRVAAANQAEQAKKQQAAQAQNNQQAQKSEQPKPVVNTSGQVTGQHINTKA